MSEHDDTLQERIEQYENGDPLEACLVGLSEQDATALRLITSMQTMPIADGDAASIAAQRNGIMQAAAVQLQGNRNNETSAAALPFWVQLQTWATKLFAYDEVKYALAAIAIILLVGFYWKGITSVRVAENDGEGIAPIANNGETGDTTVTESPASESATLAESGVVTTQGPTIFIPIVSSSLELSADTAVIQSIQGVVEVQTEADGQWTMVSNNFSLAAGQRVRTGNLSQATLSFYDGSEAYLSANTEMSLDELNALRPEDGFRTVVMTQWIGDSEHSVQFRNDGGSRYEVKTPDGSGLARGTKFHVIVAPNKLSRYIVTEGKVDVSAQNRIVGVTAGQLSTILIGNVPSEANFNIVGEGEVTALGSEWTIAGQTFQTDENTIIVGNPQLGDLVKIVGHLLPDGGRVADHIVLLRKAIVNRFNIQGEVASMGATWVVAGQSILVNEQTTVDDDISAGDTVRVEGIVLTGGTLQATKISKVDEAPGLPFDFSGVVQAMATDSWTISGQVVVVDAETAVSNDIAVGDVVTVSGWILEDGRWLASDIQAQEDDLPTFAFTGPLQSMNPWRVAGITFETRAWTTVASGLDIGDLVRVRGSILADGTWVAAAITSLADLTPDTITFVGVVGSTNPWIVNGMPLILAGNALIQDTIMVGAQVVVQARVLPNGSWEVLRIRALYPNFGYGCLTLSSPIMVVNADSIQLKHWHVHIKRDGRIKIHGDLKVNNITTLPICTGWDGTPIIIGDITVIYQPIVIIINDGGNVPSNCRVTSKGSVKCSNKGSGRGSRGSK